MSDNRSCTSKTSMKVLDVGSVLVEFIHDMKVYHGIWCIGIEESPPVFLGGTKICQQLYKLTNGVVDDMKTIVNAAHLTEIGTADVMFGWLKGTAPVVMHKTVDLFIQGKNILYYVSDSKDLHTCCPEQIHLIDYHGWWFRGIGTRSMRVYIYSKKYCRSKKNRLSTSYLIRGILINISRKSAGDFTLYILWNTWKQMRDNCGVVQVFSQ